MAKRIPISRGTCDRSEFQRLPREMTQRQVADYNRLSAAVENVYRAARQDDRRFRDELSSLQSAETRLRNERAAGEWAPEVRGQGELRLCHLSRAVRAFRESSEDLDRDRTATRQLLHGAAVALERFEASLRPKRDPVRKVPPLLHKRSRMSPAMARTQAVSKRQRDEGTFGPRWTALRRWYAFELKKRYGASYEQIALTLQLSPRTASHLVQYEVRRRGCRMP